MSPSPLINVTIRRAWPATVAVAAGCVVACAAGSHDEQAERSSRAVAIERVENDIAATASSLSVARDRQADLPGQILAADVLIADLNRQIEKAKQELRDAEDARAALISSSESRVATARERASAAATREFNAAVAKIRRARAQRNAMRARIGALPEDRSEIELENRLIRQAREENGPRFESLFQQELAVIDAEQQAGELRCTAARNHLTQLQSSRRDALALINRRHADLIATRNASQTLARKLQTLQHQRARLTETVL